MSQDYWLNRHRQTRLRDAESLREQTQIQTSIKKLAEYILTAISQISLTEFKKEDFERLLRRYGDSSLSPTPDSLLGYIDFYINLKIVVRFNQHSIDKAKVC